MGLPMQLIWLERCRNHAKNLISGTTPSVLIICESKHSTLHGLLNTSLQRSAPLMTCHNGIMTASSLNSEVIMGQVCGCEAETASSVKGPSLFVPLVKARCPVRP